VKSVYSLLAVYSCVCFSSFFELYRLIGRDSQETIHNYASIHSDIIAAMMLGRLAAGRQYFVCGET